MNTEIQIFNYNDTPVSFLPDDSAVLVNATEMAKPFGKQPYDWLKTAQAGELIEAIAETKNIGSADLVRTGKGGNIISGRPRTVSKTPTASLSDAPRYSRSCEICTYCAAITSRIRAM